jgi:hypothetical protein
MTSNSVDEELVTWNKILDEIRGDSELLIKDLLEGVRYVAASGVLIIALGLYVLFIGLRYGNVDDPVFLLGMILAPGSNFVMGAYNINKYMQLRGRYSRLFELQKQLKK